ncbi:MAG: hypothetical protein RBT70_03835 [Alphaproteobacteria bacterium]|jgi:hypothetical protein|nr:hypothetical protein [Alphaproteobacteria bacterium]
MLNVTGASLSLSSSVSGQANSTKSKTGGYDFAAALAETSAKEEAAHQAAKADFLAYARMTPAQRIRAAYLSRHKLTEEDLARMTPAERKQIEDEIKQEIEKELKHHTEEKVLKSIKMI